MPDPEFCLPFPESRRAEPAYALPIGPVDPNDEITVTFVLRRQDHEGFLEHLNEQVHAGTGHLDISEFLERGYGARHEDAHAIEQFVESHRLEITDCDVSTRRIKVKGTVGAFQDIFGTELKQYRAHGRTFRARKGELKLPYQLSGIVTAVLGLDNRPAAKPHFRRHPLADPHASGIQTFNPNDLGVLYGFPTGVKGEGQTIAVIELGGGFTGSQLRSYFSSLRISPLPTVTAVSVDSGRNQQYGPDGADGEVQLDIEVIGCLAPSAKQKVYFAPNTDAGFLDAITAAIHDPAVSIISISWGMYESAWTVQSMNAFNAAFSDAAALGKTVFAAAGDDGSTDGSDDGQNHVDFPASSPYVVGCGGTRLYANGATITGEVVWNDLPNGGGATGGGYSAQFAVPAWQIGADATRMRGVPDVAGNADPVTGYNVSIDGQRHVIGGTSAVAPLYSALVALINEKLSQAGKPRVGFPLPKLYAAKGQGFRDITQGNNGAFNAGPSWDPCTGWGSPNGQALLQLFLA
jgi:kumamolisin